MAATESPVVGNGVDGNDTANAKDLNVLIIGAGISGLLLAQGLKQVGVL
jgi:threonine dehydrogenase-like Zn-dependent dehydrogenase